MTQKFQRLLSPGAIGKLKIRNRIVLPPMVRNYATPDGFVTRQLIDSYAARARGGVGLVIVEATFVHPGGKGWPQGLGIHHDKCIPGLADLVEAVKGWGGKIAIQLHHAGRETASSITGMPLVAPSAIPCPIFGEVPRELTTEEVVELVEAFAQAAVRAKHAGFDAVEMHMAHGYLINQFLSPNTNRRTDKYGGDINGRMAFVLGIVQRTRELVGDDFPVLVRMNGEDFVENGLELDESKQAAQKLQVAGVAALDVSAGTYEGMLDPRGINVAGLTPMYFPRGQLVKYAEQIKSVVNLPVITIGAITPEMGEEILQQAKADFIAMGRNLLADPELPNKLASGEPKDIRPCIRCNEMCIGRVTNVMEPRGVRCAVNAELGFESYGIKPVLKHKRVLVIGGGPAGMEAARVSALRGHKVTLYEKKGELGGHLIEASVPSFKEDLRNYKDWLIRQLKKLDIKIELGKEITSQIVDNAKADALIIATGSTYYRPDIPGIDKAIVTTATDMLLGKAVPGNNTILAGGGAIGCETALYLAQQGKKVTIVEMLPQVATDAPQTSAALIAQLIDNGVEILTNLKIVGITGNGVTAVDRSNNVVDVIGDKVVLAMGLISEDRLYQELKDKVHETYLIGDALEPQRVSEATRDGYRRGNSL
jgi:2,4-dienoyl-CoA reductase-like NADH-dependent reductase (Old Yellow Enzyme family)/thioredoxin reductase